MATGWKLADVLRMGRAEWALWSEFYRVEPFGPRHEEHRSGVVAAVIAAANGDKRAAPERFFPTLRAQSPRATGEARKNRFAAFKAWAANLAREQR